MNIQLYLSHIIPDADVYTKDGYRIVGMAGPPRHHKHGGPYWNWQLGDGVASRVVRPWTGQRQIFTGTGNTQRPVRSWL